jgi:YegS/Rv2252/BmrU family lipid kinase
MASRQAADVRARILVNPAAAGGRERGDALRAAAGVLAEAGWTVSWRATDAPGHAQELARTAAHEGMDVVVAAGGDGTVHEVVNGLIDTTTALAVLPAGTGNVLAGQLGLMGVPTPLHRPNLPTAAEALTRGVIRPVDTGFARPRRGQGRAFLMWAGVGLDAAVARLLEGEARELKRVFGPAAYGAVGLTQAVAAGTPARIRLDDRHMKGRLLLGVLANIPLYAGAVRLTPHARLDDGILDVALFLGHGLWATLAHLGAVLTGQGGTAGERIDGRVARVRVVTAEPVPVHLDAEPFGTTPMTFDVRPSSLRLLVPPGAPAELFGGPAASRAP